MEGDIIRRCGGKPIGYFLPKKGLGGSDKIALALIGFKSLADYENYRGKLMDDSEARGIWRKLRSLAVFCRRSDRIFIGSNKGQRREELTDRNAR